MTGITSSWGLIIENHHTLHCPEMEVVKESPPVGHSSPVKSGYRLVTAAEARERTDEITTKMRQISCDIARLAGGWKIFSSTKGVWGRGEKIEEADEDEEFGHSVIVSLVTGNFILRTLTSINKILPD